MSISRSSIYDSDMIEKSSESWIFNPTYADIILVVEGEDVLAHKLVLGSRSNFFKILFGRLSLQSASQIEMQDANLEAFKAVLNFIYTGRLDFSVFETEILFEIMDLSKRYLMKKLSSSIAKYLESKLNVQNFMSIASCADKFGQQDLIEYILCFADQNADSILTLSTFGQLSDSFVQQMLSRDSFLAKEIDIFLAVQKWIEFNNIPLPDEHVAEMCKSLLDLVRLPLIPCDELLSCVLNSNFFPANAILNAIAESKGQVSNDKTCHRGIRILNENLAGEKFQAEVVFANNEQCLFALDWSGLHKLKSYAWHSIGKTGIVVKLKDQFTINYVQFLLYGGVDALSYSYRIDFSLDNKSWKTVVDNSNSECWGMQLLYFKPASARFIRIMGTSSDKALEFRAAGFSAMLKDDWPIDGESGLYCPQNDIIKSWHARMVTGSCWGKNNLCVDEEDLVYDGWKGGYMHHKIGEGCTVIQMSQPLLINNIRFLIYDKSSNFVSYFVETSVDNKNWEMAVDNRDKDLKPSWHDLDFEPIKLSFIRITGSKNTRNSREFQIVTVQCRFKVR